MLGNLLAGKGIVRAGSGNKKGKGIVRAGYGKNGIFNAASSFYKLDQQDLMDFFEEIICLKK